MYTYTYIYIYTHTYICIHVCYNDDDVQSSQACCWGSTPMYSPPRQYAQSPY